MHLRRLEGLKENNGCPKVEAAPVVDRDTDGDGVFDASDKCPNEVGAQENFGCPIKKEVMFSFDNILFETGKATIKAESFAILDKAVDILKENPRHFVRIGGHTDNQGKAAANQALSENRAKACLDYLISKGIGKDRVTSLGYGDKAPVGDNKTLEGRVKNRRVEFRLSLPK